MRWKAARYRNEEAARAWLEAALWPDGAVCRHCGRSGQATRLALQPAARGTHGRSGLYVCHGCRKQFTITVGTMFANTRVPLDKWLQAFHLMCGVESSTSALGLQRELWGADEETRKGRGSYRTAWFMWRRIRWGLTQAPAAGLMKRLARSGAEPANREEALIGALFRVKPTGDMPRPGANPTKSAMERLNQEFGALESGECGLRGTKRTNAPEGFPRPGTAGL